MMSTPQREFCRAYHHRALHPETLDDAYGDLASLTYQQALNQTLARLRMVEITIERLHLDASMPADCSSAGNDNGYALIG